MSWRWFRKAGCPADSINVSLLRKALSTAATRLAKALEKCWSGSHAVSRTRASNLLRASVIARMTLCGRLIIIKAEVIVSLYFGISAEARSLCPSPCTVFDVNQKDKFARPPPSCGGLLHIRYDGYRRLRRIAGRGCATSHLRSSRPVSATTAARPAMASNSGGGGARRSIAAAAGR